MSVPERRAMVERPGENVSVRRQCALLNLARSGVYRPGPVTGADDLALMRRIDELHLKWPFYGSRRMVFELNQAGHGVNRKRVQRLMRVMGIEALVPRPGTSKAAPGHKIYPYLLRGVSITEPNHVWASDVTYIPMALGFLYLVAIIDWATRAVLAWRLSNTMDNHDRYRDDFATPGSQTFGLMFEVPHMRNRDGDIGYWVKIKNNQRLAFVYADFSLRRVNDVSDTLKGPYGQGIAYSDILKKLKAKTQELQAEGLPVIWVIHFAPYECEPDLQLANFKTVTDAAVSLGVLCTLCGHTHVQRHVVIDGHPVFCAGSACCVDSKNNCRLHLITIKIDDAGPRVSRRNFRWSWDRDAFVEIDPDEGQVGRSR